MNCPRCGAEYRQGESTCAACGAGLAGAAPPAPPPRPPTPMAYAVAPPAAESSAAMRMVMPVGVSWVAIVAGYVGLISVLLAPAPAALVLGMLAIRHIRAAPNRHGMGRAIFAIVMGSVFTAVLALVAASIWLG